jgi:hypothetical protein
MERKELIRTVYLYLFSLLGLVLIVIGTVRLVDLGLKTFIFKKADQVVVYPEYPRVVKPTGETAEKLTPEQEEKYKQEQLEYQEREREARKERTAANSIAMIIVGVPLFAYHWRVIQRAKGEKKS